MSWTAANGTTYTNEDLERWASLQESEEYDPPHLMPVHRGRPISIGKDAQPFTIRLDHNRREKINQIAAEHHVTPSKLVRDLIDSL